MGSRFVEWDELLEEKGVERVEVEGRNRTEQNRLQHWERS